MSCLFDRPRVSFRFRPSLRGHGDDGDAQKTFLRPQSPFRVWCVVDRRALRIILASALFLMLLYYVGTSLLKDTPAIFVVNRSGFSQVHIL